MRKSWRHQTAERYTNERRDGDAWKDNSAEIEGCGAADYDVQSHTMRRNRLFGHIAIESAMVIT